MVLSSITAQEMNHACLNNVVLKGISDVEKRMVNLPIFFFFFNENFDIT